MKKIIIIMIAILVTAININSQQNVEKRNSLTLVSTTNAGSVPYGIYVQNGYAFITNNNDFLIFDLSDILRARKLSSVSVGVTFSLTIKNETAYTVGEDGLFIIDVSNPDTPHKLGHFKLQGSGKSIWIENTLAYVATSSGLEIIDISIPSRPKAISHCSEGPSRGVVIVDDIAYVANRIKGLELIDVSDPSKPKKLATLQGTIAAWNVHVNGNYLFIGRHQNGIDIFNISDTGQPRLIGHFHDDDGGEALSVWGEDDYLYVADNFGVEVLNIQDPENPRQIEELGGLGCTHDIFVEGTKIFIVSVEKGLIILEFKPDAKVIEELKPGVLNKGGIT